MKLLHPNLDAYFKLPNPGLRAYFRRTEKGNSDDYRPPFWKGLSREAVCNMWLKVIDRLGIADKYPGLYEYEMEMKSKVGPMSFQLPLKDRLEGIRDYYTSAKGEPILKEALDAVSREFKYLAGVRLRSPEQTISKMDLSKNSGSPYFTKKRNVVDKLVEAEEYLLTAILGWRGQEGGLSYDEVKQRVIWMAPFLLNLWELQFYQPAIEVVQLHKTIPAYVSFDEVDRRVTALFSSRRNSEQVVICTDFSKFDQHFGWCMQEGARSILTSVCPHLESWIERVYPIKFSIPLICSENIMFDGHHGMASGSGGTNFDESLSHRALQYECAMENGSDLNINSMAYGDDGILTYPGITVEQVMQSYTKHGQEMNLAKQMVSTSEAVVLRRWYSTSYRISNIMVGVYSTFRALGRLLAQERYYDPKLWGPKQVTLRAWAILENCKYSPYFEQFVDFVIEGDRLRLGLEVPELFDEAQSIINTLIEADTNILGYVKSGMAKTKGVKEWRIYNYLKEKRK